MKYKSVKQYETMDCAGACIASLAWYYGKKVSLPKLQKYTNMNKEGSSIYDIIEACKKIDLDANAAKKTENFTLNDVIVPCIAHVILEDGVGHYIVIYKIMKEKMIISDPSIGLLKINKDDFFKCLNTNSSPYTWSGILIFIKPGKKFLQNNKHEEKQNLFLDLILSEKKISLTIIILSAISMIFTMSGILYLKILLDFILLNRWINTLTLISLFFIVISLISIFINRLRVKKCLNMSRKINLHLSLKYFNHVLKLPISFFDTRKSGELISRFQDASKVQEVLVTSILVLPIDIILIILVGIILSLKSIKMFILVILMSLGYILIVSFFRRKYLFYNSKQMIAQAKVVDHLVESLEGIETIKTYCQEKNFYDIGKDKMVNWQNLLVDIGNVENNQAVLKKIISSIGEIIILCIGALEVLNGNLTIGDLVTYNILIRYILSPINDIINIQPQFHAAQIAMDRLETILQFPEENSNGNEVKNLNSLDINNVSFGFNHSKQILNKINLNIYSGQKIAIIGSSGSGKTTFAKLLTKFYFPQSGNIKIDNIDLSKVDSNSLRKNIVYVSQEDFIFTGSIKENLTFKKVVSDEKIINVAKLIGVHEFVKDMPLQYDSVLEERGANLSKGQKQKISIARAILQEPQILILDEATSNMDAISENNIMKALKSLKNFTLIVISHRLNNIVDSDCIYVIEKGSIVAQGKHKDLFENCDIYKSYFTK